MKKTAYHHGDLKNTLVAIATQSLVEGGRNAVSLRKVAAQAGVSGTALYRHFENKEALLAEVAAEGFHKLQSALETVLDSSLQPLERFRETGNIYADFALKNPVLYELMFSRDMLSNKNSIVDKAAEGAYGVLLSIIKNCQEIGLIRSGDIDDQAFSIFAAAHGTIALCAQGAPTFNPDATIERGLDLIWQTAMDGLQP